MVEAGVSAASETVQTAARTGLFVQYAPGVLAGIAVFTAGWIASSIVTRILRRTLSVFNMDQTLAGFAVSTIRFGILTLAGVTALEMAGVPSTSFLAVLGAAGLAISLALKDTLGHLAAGVVLVAARPFRVGDKIEAKGVSGTVTQVRLFTTTVQIDDGTIALMPNSDLTSSVIKVTREPT